MEFRNAAELRAHYDSVRNRLKNPANPKFDPESLLRRGTDFGRNIDDPVLTIETVLTAEEEAKRRNVNTAQKNYIETRNDGKDYRPSRKPKPIRNTRQRRVIDYRPMVGIKAPSYDAAYATAPVDKLIDLRDALYLKMGKIYRQHPKAVAWVQSKNEDATRARYHVIYDFRCITRASVATIMKVFGIFADTTVYRAMTKHALINGLPMPYGITADKRTVNELVPLIRKQAETDGMVILQLDAFPHVRMVAPSYLERKEKAAMQEKSGVEHKPSGSVLHTPAKHEIPAVKKQDKTGHAEEEKVTRDHFIRGTHADVILVDDVEITDLPSFPFLKETEGNREAVEKYKTDAALRESVRAFMGYDIPIPCGMKESNGGWVCGRCAKAWLHRPDSCALLDKPLLCDGASSKRLNMPSDHW